MPGAVMCRQLHGMSDFSALSRVIPVAVAYREAPLQVHTTLRCPASTHCVQGLRAATATGNVASAAMVGQWAAASCQRLGDFIPASGSPATSVMGFYAWQPTRNIINRPLHAASNIKMQPAVRAGCQRQAPGCHLACIQLLVQALPCKACRVDRPRSSGVCLAAVGDVRWG